LASHTEGADMAKYIAMLIFYDVTIFLHNFLPLNFVFYFCNINWWVKIKKKLIIFFP